MEQKELRDIEALCIQEQPPWCRAACPLHVDARAFLAQAAKGDWGAARKTLERAMPFAGILGRVCDQPCKAACKRGQAGGAVEIGAVERRCVIQAGSALRPLPIPAKPGSVAVLGAGLAGMAVALDLARKGRRVLLFTPARAVGGSLRQRFEAAILPDEELALARDLLRRFKVEVEFGRDLDPAFADGLADEHAAVFLDLDEAGHLAQGEADPATLALDRPGMFAGGGLEADGSYSPMRQASDGRRAATSMDRLLQNASLTAGRELEGPHETTLFTSLEGVESAPPEPVPEPEGYSSAQAMAEAARCLQCQCLECVKACPYLAEYKSHPKAYARQVYNNLAIVKGHHQANTFINSCMLCGQCSAICPNDFPMAGLCLNAREAMVRSGMMPPSAFDFALEDMRFNQGEHFALFRNPPGADAGRYLFFPGCQLAGSDPDLAERVYAWLGANLDGPVGLGLGCCGAPALWAGERRLFERTLADLEKTRQGLGSPTLVAACATCHHLLRTHAPDMPVVSLWEVLADMDQPQGARPLAEALALHDPCTSRDHPEVQEAVRGLAARLGQAVEELAFSRERTACCGYGGLLYNADPALARKAAEGRASENPAPYLAYCAMCRDRLAQVGKPSPHLLDLLFPGPGGEDPAARPAPGFSARHENRARLKRRLLKTVWNQEGPAMQAHEAVRLRLSPEVEKLLEERRILVEDVQRVILRAQQGGKRLKNPAGRFLACFKPVRVTYWVEYEPEDGGFRVHNAYSHRMDVPGVEQGREGGS